MASDLLAVETIEETEIDPTQPGVSWAAIAAGVKPTAGRLRSRAWAFGCFTLERQRCFSFDLQHRDRNLPMHSGCDVICDRRLFGWTHADKNFGPAHERGVFPRYRTWISGLGNSWSTNMPVSASWLWSGTGSASAFPTLSLICGQLFRCPFAYLN